jgi:RimJ/RimL family protein N-acetyltransferase
MTGARDQHEAIRASRIDLVKLSEEAIASLLDRRHSDAEACLGAEIPSDWLDEVDRQLLETRLSDLREDPDQAKWLLRAIVRREPGPLMIGHIGFHGRPGVNALGWPDGLEIGYAVFPRHRRQGYGGEAAAAVLRWASVTQEVRRFVASIANQQAPSLKIVNRLGFTYRGECCDDVDGPEAVFGLELPRGLPNDDTK